MFYKTDSLNRHFAQEESQVEQQYSVVRSPGTVAWWVCSHKGTGRWGYFFEVGGLSKLESWGEREGGRGREGEERELVKNEPPDQCVTLTHPLPVF